MMIFAEGRTLEGGFREGEFNFEHCGRGETQIEDFLNRAFDLDDSHSLRLLEGDIDPGMASRGGVRFVVVNACPVQIEAIENMGKMIANTQIRTICNGTLLSRDEIETAAKAINAAIGQTYDARTNE